MLKDSSGEHTGILHQNTTMRYNFERFVHSDSMDMMKRGMHLFL